MTNNVEKEEEEEKKKKSKRDFIDEVLFELKFSRRKWLTMVDGTKVFLFVIVIELLRYSVLLLFYNGENI